MLYTIGHSNLSKEAFLELLDGIDKVVDVRSLPGSRNFPHFNREEMGEWLTKYGIEYEWSKNLGGLRDKSQYNFTNGIRKYLSLYRFDEELVKRQLQNGCECIKHTGNDSIDIFKYFQNLAGSNTNYKDMSIPKLESRMKGIFKKIPKDSFKKECNYCHKPLIVPNWFHSSFYNYSEYMKTDNFIHSAKELLNESNDKNIAICCGEALYYSCHRSMISDYAVFNKNDAIHIMPDGSKKRHSNVIGDRLQRYSKDIIEHWKQYT